MPPASSALDQDALARARALVEPPRRPERIWPVLAAAAVMALAALSFATAMIMAPPLVTQPVAESVD